MAQMGTNEIALLVCADGADPVFNTDWNWQVLTGESYSSLDDFVVPGYYAADRGERFDANNYPWGWQTEQEAPDSIGSKPEPGCGSRQGYTRPWRPPPCASLHTTNGDARGVGRRYQLATDRCSTYKNVGID